MEKDFVKNTILKELVLSTAEHVASIYRLDLFTVASFEQVLRSGNVLDETFTEYDMLHLYHEGLTYSEIAYLRGITKVGVLFLLKKTGVHFNNSLEGHRSNRKRLKEIILNKRLQETLSTHTVEEAAKKLGYSQRYFSEQIYKGFKEEEHKEEHKEQTGGR